MPRVELSVSTSLLALRISLVTLFDRGLAGADDALQAGRLGGGKLGVVCGLRALGVDRGDVDVAVAQNAGLGNRGGRVGVQEAVT